MFAVIGGSGFEKFEEFEVIEKLNIETPFGSHSTGLKKVKVDKTEFLFVSRHGDHHELLPSEINYRANIYALKKLGAKQILSFSAVGSLKKEYAPGDCVIPFQYMDRTKSRVSTFLGDGLIGHVSLAQPICEMTAGRALELVKQIPSTHFNDSFKIHSKQTYICIEGPYFSTQAESNSYRLLGADIIGMSNFPEYALAREAGLPYVPFCFVTDYDCWDSSIPHVTVEEVIKVMKGNNVKAFSILKTLLTVPEISSESKAPHGGLKTGLFMDPAQIPENKKEWLKVLTEPN